LVANISAKPTSSMKYIARVLSVHHHNVFNAWKGCKVFSDCDVVLWKLSFQKKRVDGCINEDKVTTIAWWASETCVNPN